MRCPQCSTTDDRVVDSRTVDDGTSIRRRRECLGCARRFTTYERLEEVPFGVVKRSGRKELFDRSKVVAGVRSAAKNRPVSEAAMQALAGEVDEAVRLEGSEVTTSQVGMAVLERLRALDAVASVRFASVYKGFSGLDDFRREVGQLSEVCRPGEAGGLGVVGELTKETAPK